MTELQSVIDTLDKAADSFDQIANAEQKKIYDEVITLAKDLDLDANGNVRQSIANLKRLTEIKARLAALSKDKEWVAGISGFAKYFGVLQQQQNAYYTDHFPSLTLSETAKKKHALMKQLAVQNTMEALMGSGLKANVTDKLNDILLRAVTTNAKFADLQEELRAHLLGKNGGQGAFSRYATTYATTALSQFTGQNNKLLTDDLDCEWFMYTGSNKETSREFCIQLTAKKFIHRSEIPTILTGRIDDYQCAIYEKTGLPYGMIEGTTADNFQCNCGGWNCRHQLVPIADALVPASLRAKFAKDKPQKQETPTPNENTKQPIDLTPYQEQISAIEQYIADHPKSAKIKGYLESINSAADNGNETQLKALLQAAKKDIAKFNAAKNSVAKKKADEEKQKQIAELKGQLAQFEQWKDANVSGIKAAVEAGDVPALEAYIDNMHEIQKQLTKLDLLVDPKGAMQEFTIAELQAVQDAVANKLAQFEAKGITGEHLAKKLQFETQWVQDNKKYSTWQVAQQAYNKKLVEVQKDIALKALQPDMMQLMSVKTKSSQFKAMLSKLTQAYSNGDIPKVQQLIADMQAKVAAMQKSQQQSAAKRTQNTWDADTYSQKRKDAAMWAHSTRTADKNLRNTCGDIWRSASNEEKDAIWGYTQSYCNIQEPLRGIQYIGSDTQKKLGLKRIPQITNLLSKSKYDFDMWVQRGDDLISLKKFGLQNYNTATDAEIKSLVGRTGTESAFWSAGVAKGKGFSSKQIIYNIYCPRGTQMMYCEPFSFYGRGAGRNWDGTTKQTTFGHESEILLQRGTTLRVTKVEKARSTWYIDVEVISQNPLPFPYANGYPYPY